MKAPIGAKRGKVKLGAIGKLKPRGQRRKLQRELQSNKPTSDE